jgi:hypothetical protein
LFLTATLLTSKQAQHTVVKSRELSYGAACAQLDAHSAFGVAYRGRLNGAEVAIKKTRLQVRFRLNGGHRNPHFAPVPFDVDRRYMGLYEGALSGSVFTRDPLGRERLLSPLFLGRRSPQAGTPFGKFHIAIRPRHHTTHHTTHQTPHTTHHTPHTTHHTPHTTHHTPHTTPTPTPTPTPTHHTHTHTPTPTPLRFGRPFFRTRTSPSSLACAKSLETGRWCKSGSRART